MSQSEREEPSTLPELGKVHEFISQELQRDRDHFDRIFKRTAWFLGIMAVVAALLASFYGFRTVQEARNEARAEAGRATEAEVRRLRKAVEDRIEDEFKTERIRNLVESVARERTLDELNSIILKSVEGEVKRRVQAEQPTIQRNVQEEARRSVTALQPTLQKLVESETKRRVDEAVRPLEARLESYLEIASVANTAILARNGDRKAFDGLFNFSSSSNPQVRAFAEVSLRAVVIDHNQPFYSTQTFRESLTKAELVKLLKDPNPFTRKAAIDTLTTKWPKDSSIVRQLVEIVMNDGDLNVCASAFRALNQITGEEWQILDFDSVRRWWSTNQSKY